MRVKSKKGQKISISSKVEDMRSSLKVDFHWRVFATHVNAIKFYSREKIKAIYIVLRLKVKLGEVLL